MGQNGRKDDGDIRRQRTSSLPCHESIVQRSAQSKGGGKLSIEYCADLETTKTVFRTTTSVNPEMCEEYESFHARTVKPFVGGQSSSSFVPSVIKTNVPLNNDDHAHKHLLLQKYGERTEKSSQQDRFEQILYRCRIPECC